MTVFEKVSFLLSDSTNVQAVKNMLGKYGIYSPIKVNDLFVLSNDDLRVIVEAVSGNSDYYNTIVNNLTLLKILYKNKENALFKDKFEFAWEIIDDFLNKVNSFCDSLDDDILVHKFKDIITTTGVKEQIYNLDEFQEFLHKFSLSNLERGQIKKEVGKSNIRFAHQKISSDYNLEMFEEAEAIIKKEKSVLERDFSGILDEESLSEEQLYEFRLYSVLVALKSEVFKAKLNKYNEVVFNSCIKLIHKYIDAYNVLVKIKGEGNVLVR